MHPSRTAAAEVVIFLRGLAGKSRRQAEAGLSALLPTVRLVLELGRDIVPECKSADVEQKRQLLNYVCSNWRLTGRNLTYTTKTPFAELAEGRISSNWLRV